MRRLGTLIAYAILPVSWILTPPEASAQVGFGPQLAVGTDSGLGLGARLIVPLRVDALGVDGMIDGNYFLGGGSVVDSWIDANANVRVPVPVLENLTTRVGAGLNFTFISFDDAGVTTRTDTRVGLNLLAGIEVPHRNFLPYADLRVVVGGAEQLVFTGGISFGVGETRAASRGRRALAW